MNSLEAIGKEQLRDLMSKCWMTHDAMWFFHTVKEVGIGAANRINKAAVLDMASMEVQRLLKALGRGGEKIKSFEELKSIYLDMFGIIKADFMKGSVDFPGENVIRLTWQQCFAYDGVKRIGVLDKYQCGIYDRMEGWFKGMGLTYQAGPEFDGCMMKNEGKCYREYRFSF